jgi:hypothetical protein
VRLLSVRPYTLPSSRMAKGRVKTSALVLVLLILGCKGKAAGPAAEAGMASATTKGTPCGALGCLAFDAAEDAFAEAIAGAPRVVAIGEAHAPKGAKVPSSAKRFTEALLPTLKGRASDLLVELMNPPAGCAAQTAEVKKKQAVVTSQQAPSDQGEYVAMGERARQLGIVPDLLRPSCADMDAIRDAGDLAIEQSLVTIALLTTTKLEQLLYRDARTPGDAGKLVLTYGGALHTDRFPPPERAAWTFAPAIDAYVDGRYVSVELYVPEFIEDTDTWRKLPWYPLYDRARLGKKTTLFRPHERSFVIIFPLSGGAEEPRRD